MAQQLAPGFSSVTDGFDDGPEQVEDIIDEEELQLLRQLKDLKKSYRGAYKTLRDSKSESNFTQQAIDSLKQQLINAFEEWYTDTFEDVVPEGGSGASQHHASYRESQKAS